VASSCDEPEWARELLKLFPIDMGAGKMVLLGKLFYQTEIRFGNKQQHFRVCLQLSAVANLRSGPLVLSSQAFLISCPC
jgi:hypothetical protein